MNATRRILVLGLAVAAAAWAVQPMAMLARAEEHFGLSLLFHLRGPRQPPPSVAVVAIDQAAAAALGLPMRTIDWPRSLHGRLIDTLHAAGAGAIAFDVSFATPGASEEADRALADAIARARNVVLLDMLEPLAAPTRGVEIEQRLPPLPAFAAAAFAHGPFPLPKSGPVRAWWLEKSGAPTMPVLTARARAGSPAPLPVETRADALHLDFYGPARTLPTIGIDAVLAAASGGARGAATLRHLFAGRAVFVGFSAARPAEQDRVRDDYPTVFTREDGMALSGVEIAATAYANLGEGRWPTPPDDAARLLLLLGWGLVLGALCGGPLHGALAILATLAACGAYLALASARFTADAHWMPLVVPLAVQAPLALLGGTLWHYLEERRHRQRLGLLVDDLLPRTVVADVLGRIGPGSGPPRQVFGVFLMTDIEGFTTMSERLTPTQSTRLLNDYFAVLFPAIERHGGSVSEIAGDGTLAFWCGTERDATMCRQACLAALDIAALERAGQPAGWPPLPTRIGVHAGPITIARIGASRHHEYRAVGDAANTASRLEGLSKHLGTKLLVSDDVIAGLPGLLNRSLGEFLFAGKQRRVVVHELMAAEAEASADQRALCHAFGLALKAYQERRWADAAQAWTRLLDQYPGDGPSRFYLRLASRWLVAAPSEWDPVVRMAEK